MTAPILVGDADRSRTVERLGQAVSLGYLTLTEYEQRLDQAVSARTTVDLAGVLAGLPASRSGGTATTRPRAGRCASTWSRSWRPRR